MPEMNFELFKSLHDSVTIRNRLDFVEEDETPCKGELVDRLIAGTLKPEEEDLVKAHLGICPSCRKLLDELNIIGETFAAHLGEKWDTKKAPEIAAARKKKEKAGKKARIRSIPPQSPLSH
ncbi:MAG: zf-HC2 domain-containing protein [Candidatus Eremiobacteraeota bacterium]|nr:zf-HC2 domain-containing protein [Candidatus Eremiobacteraeota bacterium]